jgi:hypothetical protein
VVVTGKTSVKKVRGRHIQVQKYLDPLLTTQQTKNLIFKPLSDPLPYQQPLKQSCALNISPHIISGAPLSFKIDTELQNGPCLLVGQSIPLKINVTKNGHVPCKIIRSEFQTMLIEKTQVKAQVTSESSVDTWIIQSEANMNYPVGLKNQPTGSVATLRDFIYSRYPLPPDLTSSFETCNIKRTYRLVVRLGFLVGNFTVNQLDSIPSLCL